MITFELRPSPGVRDAVVPKKGLQLRIKPRAGLRRYACPCGCQRTGLFTQPRSISPHSMRLAFPE